MSKLSVHCPNCNAVFHVAEKLIGRTGTCRQCSTRFPVRRENHLCAQNEVGSDVGEDSPTGDIDWALASRLEQDSPATEISAKSNAKRSVGKSRNQATTKTESDSPPPDWVSATPHTEWGKIAGVLTVLILWLSCMVSVAVADWPETYGMIAFMVFMCVGAPLYSVSTLYSETATGVHAFNQAINRLLFTLGAIVGDILHACFRRQDKK